MDIVDYHLSFPCLKNYNVEVEETNEDIHFKYNIKPGAANKSYGIEVAKLAGVPTDVLNSAKQHLKTLEVKTKIS